MGLMQSNATLNEVADRLRSANHIVISTHVKPDGDAFGGSVALARALERIGKKAEVWHLPPLLDQFKSLLDGTVIHPVQPQAGSYPSDDADLIVIVDTSAWTQLEALHAYLTGKRDRICVLDHHIQGDDIADMRVIDPSAGSVCEVVADLIECLGLEFTKDIAVPLYLGIASDTGWFRFSNVSARNMRLAARLLDAGVDHNQLVNLSEQRDRPARLRLLGRALASMELLKRDRVALLTLRPEDYEISGATPDDSHGFADLPHCVESIEMVCLIAEPESGVVKLSLRSKPGSNAIDVNAFASHFGGGGHARASGAKMTNTSIERVRARILEELRRI
jgi:phosphoesterase RecJ-like protein